jgi:hypothetical protein
MIEMFAAAGVALYVGHHVGDYWVQTDDQAQHKGDAGRGGHLACLAHVATYVATQCVVLVGALLALGVHNTTGRFWAGVLGALAVSGVTHYAADRREHGAMFWLARKLPGKARFLALGVPHERPVTGVDGQVIGHAPGTPSLGTGAWALDQSWHLFWGVYIPALIVAAVG